MHWATKYIGLPYEPAGRGPDKVDCWGLVRLVYQREFQIELPLYPGIALETDSLKATIAIAEGLQRDWWPVSAPFDGCLVAMSQKRSIHHIGIFIAADGGKVLHCWHAAQQTVAETVHSLRMRGMKTILFYQHAKWPTS